MKKLISLLILILFFSCTAKKLAVRSKVDAEISQKNEIVDTKKSQAEVTKTIMDQSNRDVEITTKTTLYDTDKPKDPDTGKPPVKAIIETTQKKAEKNDIKTAIDYTAKEETNHTDNTKLAGQVKEDNKSVEKTKPPDWKYLFYSIVLILIIIAGFVIYRNFAKVKSLFKLFSP